MPTRVLDLGHPDDRTTVRLVETEANSHNGRYVCLSHCWGKAKVECLTTQATLERNKQYIPWDVLPKTFQDSILFTRRLDVRYLWIDSICIIQDSEDDWQREASLMCQVYQGAYLTLAAGWARDDTDGLFKEAPKEYRSIQILSPPKAHLELHPLTSRAWCFQERLLSPRVLYFNAHELVWECMTNSRCQCTVSGPIAAEDPLPKIEYAHSETVPSQDLVESWHKLVRSYSFLDLTFESDIFPALSGVAKEMQQRRNGPLYYAGLWGDSLEKDLFWYVTSSPVRAPAVWRAPSWSWASTKSYVDFRQVDVVCFQIVATEVHCAGIDPTGALRAASITLSGPMVPAVFVARGFGGVALPSVRELEIGFIQDHDFYYDPTCNEESYRNGELPVYLLYMGYRTMMVLRKPDITSYYMVLQEVPEKMSTFRRLGFGTFRDSSVTAVVPFEYQTFTII
ncbi:HET-domain-containing protein [Mytilinidion resinicola]|uniref:HET-domain-containing protein n=1 Tax=Mytilinidion resinicola TaxID=574789 RepID=A0A6A6YC09_9PEZI|nr:HET-domain-containing protein [Mytilinidion resinicola]KAF2805554.1 HET-domain-containing protein [Mytilinidion resinicola]